MVPMLQRLKQSGKKVFLLTNSMWEYTTVVMDYLVHEGGEHKDIEWESLFDVVIVGASKPGFLTNEYLSLFQVEKSGIYSYLCMCICIYIYTSSIDLYIYIYIYIHIY
jgi:hypothetical protein